MLLPLFYMRYNSVIETEVTTDVAVEPVTLNELKQHLNMLFDTSGSYDFTDDDTYLTGLIPSAREVLERYTGLSFAPKTLRVILKNDLGGIEIPWGPNVSVTTIKNSDGTTLTAGTDYKLLGNTSQAISNNWACYLDVVYTAGYAAGKLPAALKRAILEECEFRYNNRGSQNPQYRIESVDICRSALELAAPYKRTSFLV